MDTNDYDNLFNEFDKLIEYKINELKLNYENKLKSSNSSSNIITDTSNLSYDVKKILSKQKSHESKRISSSKANKNKELNNVLNIISNSAA